VTPQAISLLACGHTREPSLTLAFALRKHAGIVLDAWLDAHLDLSIVSKLDRSGGKPLGKTPPSADPGEPHGHRSQTPALKRAASGP
jgi:hypothetical protein